MKYEYFTCDVFTAEKFSGNQLAVFPHAQGLSENNMQDIAREFNFSETSFVFPPQRNGTRKVRIYTPTTEVPFAGHPNIGTAFILMIVLWIFNIRQLFLNFMLSVIVATISNYVFVDTLGLFMPTGWLIESIQKLL